MNTLLTDEQRNKLIERLAWQNYWQAEGIVKHFLEQEKLNYEKVVVVDDPEVIDRNIGVIFIYYKHGNDLCIEHLVITPEVTL